MPQHIFVPLKDPLPQQVKEINEPEGSAVPYNRVNININGNM